jgi:hypothetical protein
MTGQAQDRLARLEVAAQGRLVRMEAARFAERLGLDAAELVAEAERLLARAREIGWPAVYDELARERGITLDELHAEARGIMQENER